MNQPTEDQSDALNELKRQLRDHLLNSRLTSAALARKAGLSRSTVSAALNGDKLPTDTTVVALSHALGSDSAPLLRLRAEAAAAGVDSSDRSPQEPPAVLPQADFPGNEPLPQTPRRPGAVKLTAAVVIALAVGGVATGVWVLPDDSGGRQHDKDSHGASKVSDTAAGRLAAPPAAKALRTTLLQTSDLLGGSSIAFPRDKTKAAAAFFTYSKLEDHPLDYMERAMAAGGYVVGGVSLTVGVEGLADSEAVIHDVRLVKTATSQVPTGPAVLIGTQGDGARLMEFVVDDARPAAKIPDDGRGEGVPGTKFFQSRRIGLPKKHKETLVLNVTALRAAYDFRIALDYEVDGRKDSQFVSGSSGEPLTVRAAGSLCPPMKIRTLLSEADVNRLAPLRYSSLKYSDFSKVPYRIVRGEPDKHSINSPSCING